jgi:predicted transcriptional regulator
MMSQIEPEENRFEREKVILEEIRKDPDRHHNALIKALVPKFMAKTTFEKTRDSLIEKNVISCHMRGNRKFYQITENYQKTSMQLMERIAHSNFQYLQHEIKRLVENFHHKDVSEKISKSIQMLKELLQTDNGFTLLDSIKNSKKTLYKDEHLEIQKMIFFVLQSITKDKDAEIIFPSVMSCVGFDLSRNFEDEK